MADLQAELADYSAALIDIARDLEVDLRVLFSEDIDDIDDDPLTHFMVGYATAAAKYLDRDVVKLVEQTGAQEDSNDQDQD